MDKVEIIHLSPDQWEEYKTIKLESLKKDPEAFGTTYEEDVDKPDEEWKSRLKRVQKLKNYWMFFAKLNGKLIGMVGARETNPPDTTPTIKIYGVYIASSARGMGIGKKLMIHLLNEIKKNPKWKIVKVKVFPTQEIAINLYKSLGFKIIDKITEDFPSGIIKDTYVMEKTLGN